MHLLDLGHRTVFHVGRPEGPTDNTRTNGWRDALKERGVTAPDPIIVPDDDWRSRSRLDAPWPSW